MSLVSQQPELLRPVTRQLRSLRGALASWFAIDGAGAVLWAMLLWMAVDLPLDWFFRFDRPQRSVILLVAIAAVLWLIYRRVIRPLWSSTSDDALCLVVERSEPLLGESLITAVQLAHEEGLEQRGVSLTLVKAAVHQGIERSAAVDFRRALDRSRLRRAQILLAVAALAAGIAAAAIRAHPTMSLWFERNVLLRNVAWPQSTYLRIVGVEDGRLRIPRGDDWSQVIEVTEDSQVDPELVTIEYQPSAGRGGEPLRRIEERRYQAQFTAVNEPFRFRARGGDEVTDWVQVELVERPATTSWELRITPPAYTGRESETLPGGKGPFEVLRGSTLAIEGEANKPLSRAVLTSGRKKRVLELTGDKTFRGGLADARAAGESGETDLAAVVDGAYQLELIDREVPTPLESKRPAEFAIRIVADREPVVRARVEGLSGMILARARIPLAADASDDFALTKVQAAWKLRSDENPSEVATGAAALATTTPLPTTKTDIRQALEARELKAVAGQTLSLQVEATDNNAYDGPKTGRSDEILLQVVAEEAFRADLLRREKERRQDFEHLVKQQEDLLTDCRALAAAAAAKPISDEQKQMLMGGQKRQKLVGTNSAAIAARLEAIVVEIGLNRLEEKESEHVLEDRLVKLIIQPLHALCEQEIPQAQQKLEEARRLAGEVAARDEALNAAITRQEAVLARMKEILKHMVKSEGYQEAVNLLYAIQNSQQDVYNQSVKELQQKIKNILRPEGGSEKK